MRKHDYITIDRVFEYIENNYTPEELVVRLGFDIETLLDEIEAVIHDQRESFIKEMLENE